MTNEVNTIQNNRTTILDILQNSVKREGIDRLLSWLDQSDFFTAPASTRFHLAEEGGLATHSLHVYLRFYDLCRAETGKNDNFRMPSEETIAICALLHDICKVNYYTVDYRNVKNENGEWVKSPFYKVDDQLPYGHGEKSVYIISGFMHLSRDEAFAIRWHMGGFDDSVKGGSYALSGAFEKCPLAVLLHIADMQATYLDEVQ